MEEFLFSTVDFQLTVAISQDQIIHLESVRKQIFQLALLGQSAEFQNLDWWDGSSVFKSAVVGEPGPLLPRILLPRVCDTVSVIIAYMYSSC